MLKKAEYDEENSYRAIKTCLRNTSASSSTSSGYHHSHSSSVGSGSNFAAHNSNYSNSGGSSYHNTNHRSGTGSSQRHKQGGSLQDLVEAAHRSEQATTSAAAATAATQRFNCDYQLSGASGNNNNVRANRRQQHNNNSNNSNSNNQNAILSGKKFKNGSNSNSTTVAARQREGGSLPSNVSLDSTNMDSKLKQGLMGEEGVAIEINTIGNHSNNSNESYRSLPGQLLIEAGGNVATQFDMDDDEHMSVSLAAIQKQQQQQFDQPLEVSDASSKLWDINLDDTLWEMINQAHAGSDTLYNSQAVRRYSYPLPLSLNPITPSHPFFNQAIL